MKEIDELCNEGVDIIALDATFRNRPDGVLLDDFLKILKKNIQSSV